MLREEERRDRDCCAEVGRCSGGGKHSETPAVVQVRRAPSQEGRNSARAIGLSHSGSVPEEAG